MKTLVSFKFYKIEVCISTESTFGKLEFHLCWSSLDVRF